MALMKTAFSVQCIPSSETWEWLLKKHYAHRIPSITYAFGLYDGLTLRGVCTFGTPPAAPQRTGIAGEDMAGYVLELNRLCVDSNEQNITSWFVSRCLSMLPAAIIVSYADTEQGHTGKIYQACNFMYTGLSEKRTDWKVKGMEHLHGQTVADESKGAPSRVEYMRTKYGDDFYLKDRPRKHRYVYITGDKRFKKTARAALKYELAQYPQGDTKRYDASCEVISQGVLF